MNNLRTGDWHSTHIKHILRSTIHDSSHSTMHGRMAEGLAEVMIGGTRRGWKAAASSEWKMVDATGKAGGDGRGEGCVWMWAPRNTMPDSKKY